MKKLFLKILLLFLIFHFSALISATPAAAHVLKSDGSIGAIIHVSPEDDPIAGTSTDFFFELKDKENKFTPEKCTCTATVLQNGKAVYSQPLFQKNNSPSLENASFSYILPQKDIYIVQISGQPIKTGDFQPFTLSWDIRVARDYTGQTSQSSGNATAAVLPYIIVLAGVLVFVGILLSQKRKKKK